MNSYLKLQVEREERIAIAKWGMYDTSSQRLLQSALEELGEVAHAFNHDEGTNAIQQEIIETIGILSRMYDFVCEGR